MPQMCRKLPTSTSRAGLYPSAFLVSIAPLTTGALAALHLGVLPLARFLAALDLDALGALCRRATLDGHL
jgi:hypothetical protein